MSDIFISYSSNDRPWVEQFAKTLGTYGWSVWWDRNIPTGGSFNTVIRQELRAAKCAIIVWSERSVDSEWVQAEAAEAKKQEKYLPVKIDKSEIPLGFTQRTFQSLVDWEAGIDHPGFSQLLKDIERLVKSPPQRIEGVSRPWWKRAHPLWLVSIPTVVATVIVSGLMMWSISTRIQVELTTERVEFAVDTSASQGHAMLGPLTARALGIEKFTTISFEPESMEVADPAQYDMDKDDFPASAWRPVSLTSSNVTLSAKDRTRHPRVTIEGPNQNGLPAIRLDPMAVLPGSHVTLETRDEKGSGLTIKIAGQESFNLTVHEPVKLIVQHAGIHGLADSLFQKNEELTYRVRLPERASGIDIATQPDGPVLAPTFSSGQSATAIFSEIPVGTLDFTKQDSAGQRVSALTGQGTITFPDYPHLGSVPLKADEAIGLERLDRFTIERITLSPEDGGMKLVGYGMANQVRTKRGDIPIQYRLTKLDALWHDARLAVFFTIIAAVFTTSLGAYRLWKEFKR
jgi:hypothetical protein